MHVMKHKIQEAGPSITRKVKDAGVVDKKIGEKIASLRVSLGLTRQDLARQIGVTHQQLQKYEQGSNRISASRLLEVAAALHVSIMYFYDDISNPVDFPQIKHQRICLEVMHNFNALKRDDQRKAVSELLREMAK